MNPPLELLVNLVGIQSVSGQEMECSRYLAEVLPDYGWDTANIDEVGNLVASRGSGEKEILLLGHIDTVPGGPPMQLNEDTLWGRGSVDAKGPMAAFCVAGGRVYIPEGWKITLVGAVCEETDSRGAYHRIPLHQPRACIIGEPSGMTGVTMGYRGHLRVLVHGEDEGAHRSGDAGPLTSCIRAVSSILALIEELDVTERPVIERPSAAVVSMEGKEAGKRKAFIDLDIRIPLGMSPGSITEKIMPLVAGEGLEMDVISSIDAHMVDKDDPVVRAFRRAIRKCGHKPRLLAKGGTADFNIAAQWDCPMAAYGPGDSHLDHTGEERIHIGEFEQSIEVLARALELIMDES